MSTERFNVVFKQYPEQFQLSKKKTALWYHKSEGEGLPQYIKKHIGKSGDFIVGSKYAFDKDGWVINLEKNSEREIRNKQTAGKPNMVSINGQKIWNGAVDKHTRNNLKDFLTEYFATGIKTGLPEKIYAKANEFLQFEFIFYYPFSLRNKYVVQDIDNHSYVYMKAFTDTLTELKVIEDDNFTFYRGCYARYVEIIEEADRRLEIKIHFCQNNQRIS